MVYPTSTRSYLPARLVSILITALTAALLFSDAGSTLHAQPADIQIISEPGVEVFFDTVMMGRVNDKGTLTIKDVGAGTYETTAVKGDAKLTASIRVMDKNERIVYFDMLNGYAEDRSPVHRPSKNGLLQYASEGISYGTLTDKRDGRQYKTIVIDTCLWMAENLKFVVPGSSFYYPRDPVHEEVYGRLYTWETALVACPEGWHLPSDNDWFVLEKQLGISESLLTTRGWRTTGSQSSLKSGSGWLAAGPSEDALGFSAFPGGFRDHEGFFFNEGYFAYFWTSSGAGDEDAWYRVVTHDIPHVGRFSYSKKYAFSIRCTRRLQPGDASGE